jgi:O-antigen/teichoic acid export membrane protein
MIRKNIVNLGSLVVIQISNAMLPLIIFPFILKTIGEDGYSRIVIAEALVLIIHTFVLYSFEVNGISEIIKAKEKKNNEELSKIFFKILYTRLILLTLALVFLLSIINFLERDLSLLLLLWLLFPLSFIFQSSYFYQANEQNFFLALSVLISRLLGMYLIFNYIGSSEDIYLVPLIIGLSYTMGGLSAFIYVIYKFELNFVRISFDEIQQVLSTGKEIFFGRLSVMLFRNSNVLILNMIIDNNTAISVYSIAEKFINSLQAAIRPLNQLAFPKVISRLKNDDFPTKKLFIIIWKYTILQLFILFVLVVIGYFFIYNYVYLFSYLNDLPNKEDILYLFIIMLPSAFIGILNFMFGTAGLNELGSKVYYAKIIFTTGIISLILSFLLSYLFEEKGAAISFVLGETILFLLVIKKYFTNYIKGT